MLPEDAPLILSPNLGCPIIVATEDLADGGTITLLVAANYGMRASPLAEAFAGGLSLVPSYEGVQKRGRKPVPLEVVGPPEEVTDWDRLHPFRSLDDTRRLLSTVLHYDVLGELTRYWELRVRPACCGYQETWDYVLLDGCREVDGEDEPRPRLYDLVYEDARQKYQRTNWHSVHMIRSATGSMAFMHATDLHASRRNDEILGEVLNHGDLGKENAIDEEYVNFNDNVRTFVARANNLYADSKIDFVVMTGDLVDFAHHDWRDEPNTAENNWKVFIDLITGQGREGSPNEGLRMPVFTSTGNHDWRLHPYSLLIAKYYTEYGLTREGAELYRYRGFDTTDLEPGASRRVRAEQLLEKTYEAINQRAMSWVDRGRLWIARQLTSRIRQYVALVLAAVGVGGGGILTNYNWLWTGAGALVAAALVWILQWAAKRALRKAIEAVIDNPLHASSNALHYYLAHINPFFDYAFTVGPHRFIVMDTGSDVNTGQFLDGKTIDSIKTMSIEDNILGHSPDSRGFDSEKQYYVWSQIVWLKEALSVDQAGDGRTFLFLHAPPINTDEDNAEMQTRWESTTGEPIKKSDCILTFGTLNHYLSQLFNLCFGQREDEGEVGGPQYRMVDMVCCGHAHRNIEFRLEMHGEKLRIYSDDYAQLLLESDAPAHWWVMNRPVVAQTAAVGPKGKHDIEPPYYRVVRLDEYGTITDFDDHSAS